MARLKKEIEDKIIAMGNAGKHPEEIQRETGLKTLKPIERLIGWAPEEDPAPKKPKKKVSKKKVSKKKARKKKVQVEEVIEEDDQWADFSRQDLIDSIEFWKGKYLAAHVQLVLTDNV